MIKFLVNLFKSKINFAALILTLLPYLERLQDYINTTNWSAMTPQEIANSILGFLIILFRSFGNKEISSDKRLWNNK